MPTPQSNCISEFHSDLMTAKETSEYLHIPVPTVYHLVQRGKLPAVQIGGRWRIKRSLLDRDVLGIASGQPELRQPELRQPELRQPELSLPSVLLVDDDPDSCVLFLQFLRKANLTRSVT